MPKRLVAFEPRKAKIENVEERELAGNQVKVNVEYASPKHGSELARFRGESPHIREYYDEKWRLFLDREDSESESHSFESYVLGNQWVGTIEEVGEHVKDFKIGDRVCGYGGIQETHHVVAVNNYYLLKMPSEMSWKSAVCFDPAQFALGAIRDSHVRPGDNVAIFGLGAIGQLAAQMAINAGASYVAVVDPIEKRRNIALESGVSAAFDPVHEDVGLELKRATNKLGVDVVIETSANQMALQQGLRGLAYGGTIAYTGWAREFGSGLNLGREAHFNNANIVFSRACSEPNPDYPRWNWRRIEETCWEMLKKGLLNCENIIDPVVPFEESAKGYEKYVDQQPDKSIKMGVSFV